MLLNSNIDFNQNLIQVKSLKNEASALISLKRLFNQFSSRILVPLSALSVSWFITDESGNLTKNGVTQYHNSEIDISNLPKGNYTIRLMGEVHNFHLA